MGGTLLCHVPAQAKETLTFPVVSSPPRESPAAPRARTPASPRAPDGRCSGEAPPRAQQPEWVKGKEAEWAWHGKPGKVQPTGVAGLSKRCDGMPGSDLLWLIGPPSTSWTSCTLMMPALLPSAAAARSAMCAARHALSGPVCFSASSSAGMLLQWAGGHAKEVLEPTHRARKSGARPARS